MKEKTSNFFKENWFKLSILIVAVVFLGWIFVRPAVIKQQCSEVIDQKCINNKSLFCLQETYKRAATDKEYESCLRKYGL